MVPEKHPEETLALHPRNKHRGRYHFNELISSFPQLGPMVRLNQYNDESIDFSDPEAVLLLNKALLKHYYGISHWSIPKSYLCPPIPGRADYIHHIADLLARGNKGVIPTGKKIKCLDVGVGANCIYPIIGAKEYDWSFVGSDIEPVAIQSAAKIIDSNPALRGKVELRLQGDAGNIFRGIVKKNEHFDLTICNPPFHASPEEAQAGTLRKLSNLNRKRITKATLNFGGENKELWCTGGEEKFVQRMVAQSKPLALTCCWFSTLIAKSAHLKTVYAALKKTAAVEVKTIPMHQGNKTSRLVAWTYLAKEQQRKWINTRWH